MSGFTCKQAVESLREYLDGDVAGDLRAKLEAHLGGCTPCVEFLKSYERTPKLCKGALAAKMPQEFAEKLTDFLKSHLKK